jgi:hypothetical protein
MFKREVVIIIIIIVFLLIIFLPNKETFKNIQSFSSLQTPQKINRPNPLLYNDFPLTKRQNITHDQPSNIWKDYPVFQVGSYQQITNNLKYFRNPDEATCTPSEFCGSLYKDKKHPSNTAHWLKPVSTPNNELRVNYYNTDKDLLL